MKTTNDMIIELQDVFAKLKSGEIKQKEASELNNCVGKMVNVAKAQLTYHEMREEEPNIPFFGGDGQAAVKKPTKKPQ